MIDVGVALPVGPGVEHGDGGSGRLVADPDGLLDLPPGFAYAVVSQPGHPLTGAATFPGKWGRTYLVRNHEPGAGTDLPAVAAPDLTYDPGAAGGTTTLLVDRRNEVLSACVSLAGTFDNCAGGATPWGTWLSCEATEQKAGGARSRDHGYVFEVSPYHPEANRDPEPLAALGRFAHAAVVADPVRGHLYLTEDASGPDGLLYRCTPRTRRNGLHTLRRGGLLEALAVPGLPDLSACRRLGTELPATWKPVPDPSAATVATREQFADGDITRIPRCTGAWWGTMRKDGRVHITCSGDGQVWSYDPKRERLRLEALFPEGTGAGGPGSITVNPWGGLIIAEQREGTRQLVAVVGGRRAALARNAASDAELTGVTFSPDRRTLFVNIRDEGATCAISGPFAHLGR